jgi:hypothetical protein
MNPVNSGWPRRGEEVNSWMELTGKKPRMVCQLDHFDQFTVFGTAPNHQTTSDHLLDIVVVHLVAVPMPLVHDARAIDALGQAALIE